MKTKTPILLSEKLRDLARTEDGVQTAIAAGILDQKDSLGWPFTCLTLRNGNVAGFRLLVDAGADLSATTNLGHTPSDLATSWGQTEVVEILHAAGLDLSSARYNALIHSEEYPGTYAKCVELGIPPCREEISFSAGVAIGSLEHTS